MKIILTILCGLMILFAGGCTILAGAAGPVAIIPAGVVILNVLVLGAMHGFASPGKWVFYTLAILDVLAVIGLTITWFSLGMTDDQLNIFAVLLIAAFAVKAALTFAMGNRTAAANPTGDGT
jgi:hypothetical protein